MSKRRSRDASGQGDLFGGAGAEPPGVPSAAPLAGGALPLRAEARDARRAPTEEQRQATVPIANRMISASAGTGKTFALTEIYLGLLTGDAFGSRDQALRPAQIVAVTFTEKAAAELRGRVREELDARMQAQPETAELLKRCKDELPGAPIGTIHGFCGRLLRDAGERAAVPAGFTVLEEDESMALLDRALLDTAAETLEREPGAALTVLAREWGVGAAGKMGLVPVARTLMRTLRTRGLEAADLLPLVGAAPQDHGKALLADLYAAVREVPDKGRSRPGEALRELVSAEPQPRDAEMARRKLLAFKGACGNKSGGLPKWAQDAGLEEQIAVALDALHAPLRRALLDFLAEAARRFQAEKRRLGGLDFDDLLLEARALLRDEPDRARAYGFVLIDEFQDTNPLQKDVLFRMAFPPEGVPAPGLPRLAIVGDIKQSIYRFRGAAVEVMQAACDGLDVKPLRQNFRSRSMVLDWINHFCARGMWSGPPEFTYDAVHELAAGPPAERHAWTGPPGELLKAQGEEKVVPAEQGRWAQAQAIARRIRTLVAPRKGSALPCPVLWDRKDQARREEIRYRDLAILLRSLKGMRVYLELALTRLGVPFRMLGGASFYTRPEILDAGNLLAVAADPHDEPALLGLLRSPFVQLSDGAIFELLEAARESARPAAECLRTTRPACIQKWHAADAAAFVRGCRLLLELDAGRGQRTAAEVLDHACIETGFLSLLALRPQGEVAVEAVRGLIEISRRYESRGARTLADFSAWLRGKADAERESPGQGGGPDLMQDLPENVDAVQIGTIHSAKGLEFPVVFLAELGATPPHATPAALFDGEGRLGLRVGCQASGVAAYADRLYDRAVGRERQAEDAESRRLLYVALTRARDYLVLSGENGRTAGPWRKWVDAYDAVAENEGLPRLAQVDREAPEILEAEAGSAAGLLHLLKTGQRVPDALSNPEAARVRALVDDVRKPPHVAGGARMAEISVSVLARFLDCPRKFQYEALGGGVIPEQDDALGEPEKQAEHFRGVARETAREMGTAAHAALEAAFAGGRPEAARETWRQRATGASWPVKRAEQAWAGIETLLKSAWGRAVLAQPADRRRPECALRWRVDLGDKRAVVLTGTLDLLAGASGQAWQVVDYKLTSADACDAGALRRYAWQAGIYALAAARLLNVEDAAVAPALLFLEDEYPEPRILSRLPGAALAHLRFPALQAALNRYLDCHGGAAHPGEVWPPGAAAGVPRERALCRAEGCAFVSRCFAH